MSLSELKPAKSRTLPTPALQLIESTIGKMVAILTNHRTETCRADHEPFPSNEGRHLRAGIKLVRPTAKNAEPESGEIFIPWRNTRYEQFLGPILLPSG